MLKYPESENGDMILKRESEQHPTDCVRVMLQNIRPCPTGKITFPEDVVTLLREMQGMDRERAMIIHLNTKNNILGVENISIGSLNSSIVHPRESLKGAILSSAAHCIFVHNHPSGDPAPSREDRAITTKLVGAFDSIGIDLLDSIIIGKEGTYYSFREHGEMFPESKYKESKPGEMKIMEYGDLKTNQEDQDDKCSIATKAALEVMSERCTDGDKGTVNDALSAAKAALDHLSSKGKAIFLKEVLKIHKIDDNWEVEIESQKFSGTLKISPDGKIEILE
jgi:DNA repair protein RadC